MCSSSNCSSELPPWLHFVVALAWKQRDSLRRFILMGGIAAIAVGTLVFKFSPTDLEQADADVKKAGLAIVSLDEEAFQQLQKSNMHKKRADELRKTLEERKDSPDAACLEWCKAMFDTNTQLQKATSDRRDNLLRLTAQSLRLLADAECEILRAKDARDRGTPYPVAPRVRDLLAPIPLTK